MLKHLILPVVASMLSLSTRAQAHAGIALDYEHIQAPVYENLGSGSAVGGSVFLYAPFAHKLGLDMSLDIAGGHTTYQFLPFSPDPGFPVPAHVVSDRRDFTYAAIPVHIVYSHSFRHLRLFGGAGMAFTHLSMDPQNFHGWEMGGTCNTLSLSFKGGVELFRHIVLSGEFRPVNAVVNKTDSYQYYAYKVSNLLSVKLGYEFGPIYWTKHSTRKRPNT